MKCSLCDNHSQMEMFFVMFPRWEHNSWQAEYCFSCAEKKFRAMANLLKRKKNQDRDFITQEPIWVEKLTTHGDCK